MHYFKIAVSLTELLKESIKRKKIESFIFFQKAETAFMCLWEAFCSVFILRHFNSQLSIQLKTDIFEFTFIRILLQQFQSQNSDETIWHSMIYWSKKITDVEMHYEIYNEKLLMIIMSFKHWWHYLKNNNYFIKVMLNHNNLQYFMRKV